MTNFFDLPAELRNRIYEAYTDDYIQSQGKNYARFNGITTKDIPTLLYANRQSQVEFGQVRDHLSKRACLTLTWNDLQIALRALKNKNQSLLQEEESTAEQLRRFECSKYCNRWCPHGD